MTCESVSFIIGPIVVLSCVYLYAVMGVVMMTGIMAIFEMSLSLTGQSLLQAPLSAIQRIRKIKPKMHGYYRVYLEDFNESELANGLCSALNEVDGEPWALIENLQPDDYFSGSCELNRGGLSHCCQEKIIMMIAYQLFSCALAVGKSKCSFEER